jgi:hypothetical protein
VRIVAAITLVLLALGGCGGGPAPARGAAADAGAVVPAGALSCAAWDGERPPTADPQLLRSLAQDLPGTDSGIGAGMPPTQVTVGLACVTLPASAVIAALYCGAAEIGVGARPCQIGQECQIGSIMVTEVSRFEDPGGVATCAVFENWSKTQTRNISLWVRAR